MIFSNFQPVDRTHYYPEKVKRNIMAELAASCQQIFTSLALSTNFDSEEIIEVGSKSCTSTYQQQRKLLNKIKPEMMRNQKGYVPLGLLLQCNKIKAILQQMIPTSDKCQDLPRQQIALGLLRRSLLQYSKKLWANYRSVRQLNEISIILSQPEKHHKNQDEPAQQSEKDQQEEDREKEIMECGGSYEIMEGMRRLQINPYISHQMGPELASCYEDNILNYDNTLFFV